MRNLKQQKEQIQEPNKFRQLMINYLDIVIRSLISFVGIGVILGIILIGYLKMNFIFAFIIIFILSIIIAPFLSKIKLGEVVFLKYENWLEEKFKLKS